jgi:uncharacterized protein (TIGR03086 family)
MNPSSLADAQATLREVLTNVTADQLDLATPCASWNVAQLVDHAIGAQHWARCAVEGVEMTGGDSIDRTDLVATFDDAAAAALAAFNVDGAMDRMVDPGFGPMPATALLGLATTDTLTHAWDLAKATGQSTDLSPDLADALLAASKVAIQDSFRGPEGAPFGPEKSAPEGATSADQLAAFLGREV